MRKFLFLVFIALLGVSLMRFTLNQVKKQVRSDLYSTVSITPEAKPFIAENHTNSDATSLFVPYWTTTNPMKNLDAYSEIYYFGITPSDSGVDTTDVGYKGLSKFVGATRGANTFLTLRMLDVNQNSSILSDKAKQTKLIAQTISLAKKQGMKGVVLDLEQSSFPFDSLISQISAFSKSFYTEAHNQNMKFYVTMYGDVFYRVRPYDVKAIAQNTDRMIIMAYDFHKARGNPGPNFPLTGKDTYGYDLTRLTQDFLAIMPADTVSVAFGYYGYDWEVDKDGKSITNGTAISTKEIKATFIDTCKYSKCEWNRDSTSGETKVTYIDENEKSHMIWYEDEVSVAQKKKYLQKYGISHFTTWAYSYF
jgi:spore germination protein YaaH